jgi:deubiquitinase DESI2
MGNRNEGAASPVVLNVYDLTPANDYFYWIGFGVFHSGIEGSDRDPFPLLLLQGY